MTPYMTITKQDDVAMYLQTAFDLTIASPFLLPAARLSAPLSAPQIDVSIVCEEDQGPYRPNVSPECVVTTAPGKIVMRWEDVGEFHLYDGERIVIRRKPGVSDDLLNLFLSGSVFAMLLYQRGVTVLHGSVVAIEDQAIAFLAPKGFGKSTLAMALHSLGAKLVSDDIVAIPETSPAPVVLNAFTQAKLWPDSLSELGYSVSEQPRLRDEVDKRGVEVGFDKQGALPLHHLFILGRGQELLFYPLDQKHALMTLLPHWYLGRYGTATVKTLAATARQFTQCLSLIEKIPVTALVRPSSFAELQHVAEAVWEYVVTGHAASATVSSQNIKAAHSPELALVEAKS
jgi:hypothetical protein